MKKKAPLSCRVIVAWSLCQWFWMTKQKVLLTRRNWKRPLYIFTFHNTVLRKLSTINVISPIPRSSPCTLQVFRVFSKIVAWEGRIFSFLFIWFPVFLLPVCFHFRSRDQWMGAERSYSRDQNNNVTSTNQPESLVVHCCLQWREKLGEIWACRTDSMSSPSPGKRRIDTDVIKLYPCKSLRVILSWFVLFSVGKSRAKMALAWWSFCVLW